MEAEHARISPDRYPAARDRLPADTVKKHVSHLLASSAPPTAPKPSPGRQLGLIP